MKLMISLLLLSSCASANWKERIVAFEKQSWRICTKEIDGEELHLKGLCYISKEVKERFLLKDLVRQKHYFCSFEDLECMAKHAHSGKRLKL